MYEQSFKYITQVNMAGFLSRASNRPVSDLQTSKWVHHFCHMTHFCVPCHYIPKLSITMILYHDFQYCVNTTLNYIIILKIIQHLCFNTHNGYKFFPEFFPNSVSLHLYFDCDSLAKIKRKYKIKGNFDW